MKKESKNISFHEDLPSRSLHPDHWKKHVGYKLFFEGKKNLKPYLLNHCPYEVLTPIEDRGMAKSYS